MPRPPAAIPLVLAAATLVALPGCGGGSGGRATSSTAAAAQTPNATGYDGALLPSNLPPRPFTLIDQHGRRVSLSDFHGRVTILTFLYTTSHTTAPLVAQQIQGALDELESSSSHPPPPAIAISVDPTADTPARTRAFLTAASLTGRMEYLTGGTPQLRQVWRAYAAVPAAAGPIAYERGAFVLLLDRRGAPRVELPFEELTAEALAHDIRRLERE